MALGDFTPKQSKHPRFSEDGRSSLCLYRSLTAFSFANCQDVSLIQSKQPTSGSGLVKRLECLPFPLFPVGDVISIRMMLSFSEDEEDADGTFKGQDTSYSLCCGFFLAIEHFSALVVSLLS